MASDIRTLYQKNRAKFAHSSFEKPFVSADEIMEENPNNQCELASILCRFIAWGLDTCIVILFCLFLFKIFDTYMQIPLTPEEISACIIKNFNFFDTFQILEANAYVFLVYFFWFIYIQSVSFIYGTIFEMYPLQATIGKLMLGSFITDFNGQPCYFLDIVVRNLAKVLSITPCFLGCFPILFTEHKQTLYDILGCSYVFTNKHNSKQQLITIVLGLFVISIVFPLIIIIAIKQPPQIPQNVTYQMPQSSITVVKNSPQKTKNILKPNERALGQIKIDNKTFQIKDQFFRISNFESFSLIEGALFSEELQPRERRKLTKTTKFADYLKNNLASKALLITNTSYNQTSMYCETQQIIASSIGVMPKLLQPNSNNILYIQLIKDFSLLADKTRLNTFCRGLNAGSSFSYHLSLNNFVSKLPIEINVKFNAQFASYDPIERIEYSAAISTQAIFSEAIKKLTINLQTGILDPAKQREDNPTKSPDIVIEIPLHLEQIPHVQNQKLADAITQKKMTISQNMLRNGYTLRFFRRPNETLKFSKENEHTFKISYPTFGKSLQLSGLLITGNTIKGNITGKTKLYDSDGPVELSWNIPFSAEVTTIQK